MLGEQFTGSWRFWLFWMLAFLAFPNGGLLSIRAILAGAITGLALYFLIRYSTGVK